MRFFELFISFANSFEFSIEFQTFNEFLSFTTNVYILASKLPLGCTVIQCEWYVDDCHGVTVANIFSTHIMP